MPPSTPVVDEQTGAVIPRSGEWPVEPQEAMTVSEVRLWVDGCFDFAHHGHAGAILQAKRLGDELLVGVHSDAEILEHKGPPVMNLSERIAAASACRWTNKVIPSAPYVTSIPWIDHYGSKYVVHGDDITTDSSGGDCYRFVKSANRMKIVKRTPGISTTDLVQRLLDGKDTSHHILPNLHVALKGQREQNGARHGKETGETAAAMLQRIQDYATDASGHKPLIEVFTWAPDSQERMTEEEALNSRWAVRKLVSGKPPVPGQRVVYVDGTFDLFSTGHIEFLKQVVEKEHGLARKRGWFDSGEAKNMKQEREDGRYRHDPTYEVPPAYVVVGVHDDDVVNNIKGANYPIMNIFERGLCVLQCKYVNAVVFGAPFSPSEAFLQALPYFRPEALYHGPQAVQTGAVDPYADAKRLGIYQQLGAHKWSDVTVGQIKDRVLKNREQYEARQRAKGVKAVNEAAMKDA